jgi:ABC-2 type transport system ATP-binding protein
MTPDAEPIDDPNAGDQSSPDQQPASGDRSPRRMIEAIGLSKFYGPFAAARDVTFSVSEGELVAFLGPNGAGKSTTMKMLTGYIAPSEGEARIAGNNMMENRIEGSRHLGYLPENGPLYPEMTPLDMLDFFAEARGLTSDKKKERIDAVVEICDLSSVLYKPISKLSKGFKQRCGMSQALLHDPDVLILDEPTAGLDPNQIRGVRKTMRRLGETKTILLSTHILQEVEAMASRVVMIYEGRLVYDGDVDRLREIGEGDLDQAFYALTRDEAA